MTSGAFQRGPDPRRGLGFRGPRKPRRPLAEYIRGETRQGQELVDRLLEIARGTARATRSALAKGGGLVELLEGPTIRDQLVAIQALWDRGMGRSIPQDKMPEPAEAEQAGDADGIEPPKLGVA